MSKTKWGVPRRMYFAVILRCAAGLCALLPALPMSVAAQEQQQQDQRPPVDKTTADGAAQASTTVATGTPASKPKHVITNDDIKPSCLSNVDWHTLLCAL